MYNPADIIIPEITPAAKLLDALYYALLEELLRDSDRTLVLLLSGAAALLGLALCFFGWRLRRVIGAVLGAVAVFFLAVVLYNSYSIGLGSGTFTVIVLAVMALIGVLLFRFSRAGEFVLAFLSAGLVVFALTISPYGDLTVSRLLPSLLAGAVYAAAAMRWKRPLIILASAVFGGCLAGTFGMLVVNSTAVSNFKTAIVVLAAAGFAVQWLRARKPEGKTPAAPAVPGGSGPVLQDTTVKPIGGEKKD